MMLFCQQKKAKYITIVAGIVIAAHFYLVWVVCLKTVTHHFSIPLSAPVSSVRMKLNKSIPVVKKQTAQSSSNNTKPVQAVQKQVPSVTKKQGQKASAQKTIHKSSAAKKDVSKKSEPKKSASQEKQKTVEPKKNEPVIQSNAKPFLNTTVEQRIVQTKIDQSPGVSTVDYYDVVYTTIIEQWRPPIGIAKGTSCTVSFSIDKKGVPVEIVFDKKSEILMFDMSIKTVLAHVTFSSLFVGHRFSIVFTV